jgi:hypothetical protein
MELFFFEDVDIIMPETISARSQYSVQKWVGLAMQA